MNKEKYWRGNQIFLPIKKEIFGYGPSFINVMWNDDNNKKKDQRNPKKKNENDN